MNKNKRNDMSLSKIDWHIFEDTIHKKLQLSHAKKNLICFQRYRVNDGCIKFPVKT